MIVLLIAPVTKAQDTSEEPIAPENMVAIEFPENVQLSILVDYVSRRLDIHILYDEQLANKKITLKSPKEIPVTSLMGLLESALLTKGLAIVDAEQPGWKRIIATTQLTTNSAISKPSTPTEGISAAVTQIFSLRYINPTKIEQTIKPFLTQPGGNSLSITEQSLLIVSDTAHNIQRIRELLNVIDVPQPDINIGFITVHYADAAELTAQVEKMLTAKGKADQGTRGGAPNLQFSHDPRTNQIAIIGTDDAIADALTVIEALDVPVPETRSPVRFYQLTNTTASEVLETLRSLEIGDQVVAVTFEELHEYTEISTPVEASPDPERPTPTPTPMPPAASPPTTKLPNSPNLFTDAPSEAATARIVADKHTNSIIVVGNPDIQKIYSELIHRLDRRRPQVLIETTLVTLDTSDGFSFGVEISRSEDFDSSRILTFSSFGLSEVDPDTGQLVLTPGIGFNGTLISADIADVVVRALKRTSRAKVSSAPRILVNDNGEGKLSSTAQEPYESVNASDTVATTSFGGFVEAGTTITLTPHISEDDYLQLEYSVELSSFSGERIENLPPPRQQNVIESRVTIPNGHTIIVGGLRRNDHTETIRAVPILGEIPILEYLFSDRSINSAESTLFIFIRPVILRDDEFEDLKYLSQRDLKNAEMPDDYPTSEPMEIDRPLESLPEASNEAHSPATD